MPTRRDYDADPERYRLGVRQSALHGVRGADLHTRIVRLVRAHGAERVLDVGCGEGALARAAAGSPTLVYGLDGSEAMVRSARRHAPAVQGDVAALPFADGSVDAVVAVNVLDHLDRPASGLREAQRVLRAGGLFVAGTISRSDSPELAPYWRPPGSPFDTEDAVAQVAAVFGSAGSDPWDARLITLPDRAAVADYLRVRFVPAAESERIAGLIAERGPLPLPVTKRGALVIARRT